MCGIHALRGQGHGCRFTMCHASLKMALLVHKVGLVTITVPTTVVNLIKLSSFIGFDANRNKSYLQEFPKKYSTLETLLTWQKIYRVS